MSDAVNPEVNPENRPDTAALSFPLDPLLTSVVGCVHTCPMKR